MPETTVTVSEGKATITAKIELPKEVQEKLTEGLKKSNCRRERSSICDNNS